MPKVIYIGDADIETPANGGLEVVEPGDILELDDVTAGGLVGYGHGVWRYVDEDGVQVDPVDTTPADAAEAETPEHEEPTGVLDTQAGGAGDIEESA